MKNRLRLALAVTALLSVAGCSAFANQSAPDKTAFANTGRSQSNSPVDELTFDMGDTLDESVNPSFGTTLLANSNWALTADNNTSDGFNVLVHAPTRCTLLLFKATTAGLTWDLSNDEVASRRAIEDYIFDLLPEGAGDIPVNAQGLAKAVTFGAARRASHNDFIAARTFASLGVYLMEIVQCPVGTDPVDFYTQEIDNNLFVALDDD